VAATETEGRAAFLSSGTWSLLGTEVRKPVMTSRALELNFTNEGGVCGTTRLLKNIAGLWLVQSCRRCWKERGEEHSYEGLMQAAADADAFGSLIDPDAGVFLNPTDMAEEIAGFCRKTGQKAPSMAGAFTRAILESLAFKYRMVLESLEELIGHRLPEIRIIGGGSKNRLLNQFTANATGRTVSAGPVEATALGNIAMQMVATSGMPLADARDIIARSFPAERFEPRDTGLWDGEYGRFRSYAAGQASC
jgi:sugar (pentulose or hexulose) kinase